MPDIEPKRLTQLDLVKRAGSDGNTLRVAKILHEKNPLFQDLEFMEASDRNTHIIARTADLGEGPDIRILNKGVGENRTSIEQDEEKVILLEKYAKMDNLIFTGPNGQALRQQENGNIVEKMGQSANKKLLYGGPADLAADGAYFNGMAIRRNKITERSDRFHNVINNGSTTATGNTSIFIVQHGVGNTYGIYPNASNAGIKVRNLGETMETNNGKSLQIVSTLFQQGLGLCVEDPMSLIRVANISPWERGTAGEKVIDPMILLEAVHMLRDPSRAVMYVNRHVITALTKDAVLKENVRYTEKDPYGRMMMTFLGIPLRILDQISTNEELVA